MNTSHNVYIGEQILEWQTSERFLHLTTDQGGRYRIPFSMLGQFRDPYAPHAGSELLILPHPPLVERVESTDEDLVVHFADGRVLSAPLRWFPRLFYGTPPERQAVEIIRGTLLHWEMLDEDIEAITLFKMTGPSAESEGSIQRWLARRNGWQAEQQDEAIAVAHAAPQLAEEQVDYRAES